MRIESVLTKLNKTGLLLKQLKCENTLTKMYMYTATLVTVLSINPHDLKP